MLIDSVLPEYDVSEHHQLRVLAPAAATYEAALRVDLARSRTIRALVAARRLPALVQRRGHGRARGTMTLGDLQRGGFVLVREEPGTELVLGVVGRFWRPSGSIYPVAAEAFTDYDGTGQAKAAWNFRVEPRGDDRCVVFTETRVRCVDDRTRRKFLLYWALIGPFSGFIRKQALALIKADAEGA